MHIFPGKTHHFTKWELLAEEIVIIVIICVMLTAACLAASTLMPIRANIVQCGARADLPAKCREDQRCCALLGQSGGMAMPPPAADSAADHVTDFPGPAAPEEDRAIDE